MSRAALQAGLRGQHSDGSPALTLLNVTEQTVHGKRSRARSDSCPLLFDKFIIQVSYSLVWKTDKEKLTGATVCAEEIDCC